MKKIKLIWLTVFVGLVSGTGFAQKMQRVESKLKQVTLYRNGAEVTRKTALSLEPGLHELVFPNLSSSLDKESIRLSGLGDLTVLSILTRSNYNKESERENIIKMLVKERDGIKDKLTIERGLQQVYAREEEMLVKNQEIGGANTGVKMLELKDAIDFQRKRMTEILLKKVETSNNIKKLEDDLKSVGEKLTPLQTESQKSANEIAVQVSVKKLTQVELNLSYYVADAGWYPLYDAKVETPAAPLSIAYKAGVFQYSGEDWKKIKLFLSTANPKEKTVVPVLQTWYWGIPNDYGIYQTGAGDNLPVVGGVSEVSGFVKDEENNALAGASVVLKGSNIGVVTDENGFYQLSIPPNVASAQRMLEYLFIGYQSVSKGITSDKMDIAMKPDVQALQEVVVAGHGSLKTKLSGRVAGLSVTGNNVVPKSIKLETTEREASTSVTYEIPVDYTLLSDGKTYTVDIKEENVADSYYEYVSIPKIKPDVYLNVYLPNWNQLNLLTGDVNLFLEDSYVGKTRLSVEAASDTLAFSFGADKSVIVQREQLKTFTKKQFFGNSVSENRAYRIVVRNTKKIPAHIMVKDQFPVSKNKEVEISDRSAPDARVNETTGEVVWKLTLQAGESKELNFKYTVKYPKTGYVTRE